MSDVPIEGFRDLLDGAKILRDVNPEHCIPFTRVRSIVLSGIERLKMEFNQITSGSLGYIAVGSFPYVVELIGAYQPMIEEYLMSKFGLTKEEARTRRLQVPIWYGIVDGAHRVIALLELAEEHPKQWKGFYFTALLITKPVPLSDLRALARALNRRESKSFVVQESFADRLMSLRQEAEDMFVQNGKRPTNKEVSRQYLRSSPVRKVSSVNSTAQESQYARNMSKELVEAVLAISSFEDPVIVQAVESDHARVLRSRARGNVIQVDPPQDPRVHLDLFKLGNLRVQALQKSTARVQVGAVWRAKQVHREKDFKAVNKKTIESLVQAAEEAVRELEKFERLNGTKWPVALEQVRENLSTTTLLDNDVRRNLSSESQLLPVIETILKEKCPSTYATVMRKIADVESGSSSKISVDDDDGDVDSSENGYSVTPTDKGSKDGEGSATEKDTARESEDSCRDGGGVPTVLSRLSCDVKHDRWQDFQNTSPLFNKSVVGKVDLILTEPPQSGTFSNNDHQTVIGVQEMKDFAAHCNRILKDTGVVHLFCRWDSLTTWVKVFHEAGLSTAKNPMVYIRNGQQRLRTKGEPQNIADFAILAFKPGREHHYNSKPDYRLISSSYSRTFNVMDNVTPASRLKFPAEGGGIRKNVRQDEKNTDFLSELIVTYCPEGGLVYDPYAGTLTTAMASMRMRRKSISIECDEHCFKIAEKRLKKIGNALLSRRPSYEDAGDRENDSSEDFVRAGKRKKNPSPTTRCSPSSAQPQQKRGAMNNGNHCAADACLRPQTPLPEQATKCSGRQSDNRCGKRIHDLCCFAKQHQTPEQVREGTYDCIGFCSRLCFESRNA